MSHYPTSVVNEILKLKSISNMKDLLNSPWSKTIEDFTIGTIITPLNKMDMGNYSYELTAPYGSVMEPNFEPCFSPKEMLSMGVFEGKYLNDCVLEFPKEWFTEAMVNKKLSPEGPDLSCNYFKIKSRLSLKHWVDNKWIGFCNSDNDNRGWFQWYCRYYLGRRIDEVDMKQKKRWKAFFRHVAQVKKSGCTIEERKRQRQGLLQWSHNCFIVGDNQSLVINN